MDEGDKKTVILKWKREEYLELLRRKDTIWTIKKQSDYMISVINVVMVYLKNYLNLVVQRSMYLKILRM